jgi:nucleoside-diphosphate-sugar epimerase
MRITIFGATGGIGAELLLQSLAAGHTVTVAVRNPSRLPGNRNGTRVVPRTWTRPIPEHSSRPWQARMQCSQASGRDR